MTKINFRSSLAERLEGEVPAHTDRYDSKDKLGKAIIIYYDFKGNLYGQNQLLGYEVCNTLSRRCNSH